MPNKRIKDLTLNSADLNSADLIPVDKYKVIDGSFVTRYTTGSKISNLLINQLNESYKKIVYKSTTRVTSAFPSGDTYATVNIFPNFKTYFPYGVYEVRIHVVSQDVSLGTHTTPYRATCAGGLYSIVTSTTDGTPATSYLYQLNGYTLYNNVSNGVTIDTSVIVFSPHLGVNVKNPAGFLQYIDVVSTVEVIFYSPTDDGLTI